MPAIPTMSIPVSESRGPYVLAMDIGSTASRGGLYDASGRPLKGSKQRVAHSFTVGDCGASTIDADQVVAEIGRIIDGVLHFAELNGLADRIAAVALDTFASSMIAVDGDSRALTPCITYADARSAPYVEQLRERVDERDYHLRTGVRLHTSYHPSRLLWLREEYPDLFNRTATVMTIGEYVYLALAGIRGLSTSMAAWSGILNAHTAELDTATCEMVGVSPELFAPLAEPDEPAVAGEVGRRWASISGVPWFHAIPDGWSSNIGPGAVDSRTVAAAAATSGAMRVLLPEVPGEIPEGLWCYRLSRSRCIVGGALNDVGRAVSWLEHTLAPVDNLAGILAGPPLPASPDVLPFFTGERATGWANGARAAFTGISAATGPEHIWRGVFEAVALSYQRVWEQMARAGATPERVIASGSVVVDHPEWLQMLADALDTPVIPLTMKRSTLRGTALIALDALDPGGTRALPPLGTAFDPVHVAHYRRARSIFDELYRKLV
ncbi:gluconokinase [Corynebacterium pacaense]|uniref:gluconokinase n=1 Tax=Corynebacterium pacaense TaxID=1816684 RepID=UPI0009BAA505|nr:gluconokinase [Corynebacterium pacaense]